MHFLDYVVLVGYFGVMILIGYLCSRQIKGQDDFFMGGRGFGKLLQTFAAFGAGTGSSDPVNTGRGVFVGGMSGMWSVMTWLFVTPFYWITGVWYRRMRHLTLGDWYVERYESKALGGAYAIFGILFMMIYGSMLFSAIGKVAAPLMETETLNVFGNSVAIEYVLVPVIGLVVLLYGIAGGLAAAYYTDLIQGICVILLSIILIPYGLQELVKAFGSPETEGLMAGFKYIHQQAPASHFDIVGSTTGSEWPLYRILAVIVISLIGIVVQPHFIATGGGSAKTEMNARVGLVTGNFLKRFCTIGWVLTGLITLALYAGKTELVQDPDKVWGFASREILSPLKLGLVGLMLACLLAALMSSVDAYMVVGSGLVVRNLYAAFINSKASEARYVRVGRITGVLIVAGAVVISLFMMNVFKQLQLTWVFPVIFAAPFWVGMYWRRATTWAAWITVLFNVAFFFALPKLLPVVMPEMRTNQTLAASTDQTVTTSQREASPSDVEARKVFVELWTEGQKELAEARQTVNENRNSDEAEKQLAAARAGLKKLDESNRPLSRSEAEAGSKDLDERLSLPKLPFGEKETIFTIKKSGGTAVFWSGGVEAIDESGEPVNVKRERVSIENNDGIKTDSLRYQEGVRFRGKGDLETGRLLIHYLGFRMTGLSDAMLDTLKLPAWIVLPFLVMILFSFLTPRNSQAALDSYYAKMKTPVSPDPATDQRNLQASLADRDGCEAKKLFPNSDFEFQRPSALDIIGFIVSFALCFVIIGLALWMAGLGAEG